MSAIDTNAIGERGEAIFFTRMTALHGRYPLFRPAFLGDKWAVADFAVELVGHPGKYFLVQVKSTTRGLNARSRLRVGVSTERYQQLVNAWIPSYVVGIDDATEEAYIWAAGPRTAGPTSLKTQYPLRDAAVRQQLHDEVRSFWQTASAGVRPWVSRLY